MLRLHQFKASHFNEKVRWALDFKNVPHARVSYLPGPHFGPIRRRSGGPTTTPLLEHADGFLSGSTAILEWLEARHPAPALYPQDPAAAERARSLVRRFDEEVGPATRTAVFSVFLEEPGYLCRTFSAGKPWLARAAYRATFPLAKPLIRKGNNVFPEAVEAAFERSRAALDEVASASAATGYLVGDGFSVADLTAASLLAPLANVDHPDMRREAPLPAAFRAFIERWADHAGVRWVHEMYARHRPAGSGGAPNA